MADENKAGLIGGVVDAIRSGVFKWIASAVALVLGAIAALTWTSFGHPLVYNLSHPLPIIDRGQYVVLVTDLAGDDDQRTQSQRVWSQLGSQFSDLGNDSPIRVVRWPRTLYSKGNGDEGAASAAAEREGQKWLATSGARVLIWGVVRKDNKELEVRLVRPNQVRVDQGLPRPFEDAGFRAALIAKVAPALAAVIAADAAPAYQTGSFVTGVLAPLVEKLKPLALSNALPDDARAIMLASYADAATTLGLQSGANAMLQDAIAAYRAELEILARGDDPAKRATAQVNLGRALAILGDREPDTTNLHAAVAAFTDALAGYPKDRTPADWALVKNDIGVTLSKIGAREADSANFEAAIAAYNEALSVRTREQRAYDWAVTQGNLGVAQQQLGLRSGDLASVRASLISLQNALQVFTREREPALWAATQNNLGNSFVSVGVTEISDSNLKSAASAYRRAISAYDPQKAPLFWAATVGNLAGALEGIGERESGVVTLKSAVASYQDALSAYTPRRAQDPLAWANTQDGLGIALEKIGEREMGSESFNAAIAAFRVALEERTRERAPIPFATTQSNLARALANSSRRTHAPAILADAAKASQAALAVLTRKDNGPDWADAQEVRGIVLENQALAGRTELFPQAQAAFAAALEAYNTQGNAYGAMRVKENSDRLAKVRGE